jgi:hypothetical protein
MGRIVYLERKGRELDSQGYLFPNDWRRGEKQFPPRFFGYILLGNAKKVFVDSRR